MLPFVIAIDIRLQRLNQEDEIATANNYLTASVKMEQQLGFMIAKACKIIPITNNCCNYW